MAQSSNSNARQSSLHSLPPPKSASSSKEADSSPSKSGSGKSSAGVTVTSGGLSYAAAAKGSGGELEADVLDSKLERIISARLEALLSQKLATAGAVAALPNPSIKPKAPANAPVGHGMLAELRANVGVGLGKAGRAQAKENDEPEDADYDADGQDAGGDDFASGGAAESSVESKQKRLAADILERVEPYGSVKAWVKMYEWKNARNRRECEAIAQAVDALRAEGVTTSSLGIEILLRRLSGVQLADLTGKWEACESVAWSSFGSSLLPRAELRRVLKDADQMTRLTAPTASTTGKKAFASRDRDQSASGGAKPKGQWVKKAHSGSATAASKSGKGSSTSAEESTSK
jgi:hypothetical protein